LHKTDKLIKKTVKILIYFILSLIIFLSATLVLLNNSKIQNSLAQKAAQFISSEIKSNVTVGSAEFGLFDRITLNNVCIKDQHSDTLLFAKELKAKFNLFLFLDGKFIFPSIKLDGMRLVLKNDTLHGNNFDFIIEALKSKNQNEKKNLFFQFKSIQLTDCDISYTSNRKPAQTDRFDANNLEINNLQSKISINYFTKDSLSAQLKNISFTEKSGLNVKNITAAINANKQHLNISNFEISLPRTEFKTNTIKLKYKDFRNFNHFLDSVNFNLEIKPSIICLADLSCFAPKLKSLLHPINISGTFNGPVSKMSCPDLHIAYGNSTKLSGNFEFVGLPLLDNTFVFARISNLSSTKYDIEDFIANLTQKPYQLPQQLKSIDKINFKGKLTGYLRDLTATGDIETNIGNIYTDLHLSTNKDLQTYTYKGQIKTNNFELGKLLARNEVGTISLNVDVKGEKKKDKSPSFDIKGTVSTFTYNNYTYNNIALNGLYSKNQFNGKINIDDVNGKAEIDGLLDFSKELPIYDFTATVEHFQPNKMKLTTKYPDLVFSFQANTKIKGKTLDDIAGNIRANNISIKNGDKELIIKKFEINSDISDTLSSIIIASDFLNGTVEGKYNISTLVNSFKYVASQYLPVLNNADKSSIERTTDNNFDFDLKINNLDAISSLLNLKWNTSSEINLFGFYDDKTRKFRIKGIVPELMYNKTKISEVNFLCENPEKAIKFAIDAKTSKSQDDIYDIFFRASATNDSLTATLEWNNNGKRSYAGQLSTITTFTRNETKDLITNTNILPSNIIFSDTLWNIKSSTVATQPEKIFINNFYLENKNQSININGIASKSSTDVLTADLKNVRLCYLDQFLNMGMFELDGKITGSATMTRVLDNPTFDLNTNVKDFSFNHSEWGDVAVRSIWENDLERLNTNITATNNDSTIIELSGNIYPKRDIYLDLAIKSNNLKIEFLQPFLANVLQDVKGRAFTHNLKMFGPLTKPNFEGNVFIKNGDFNINYLKTNYSFSDTIRITQNSFKFNNLKIYDSEGNSGRMTGIINHNSFKNFTFNINGNCKNILGLNTKKTDNHSFYGKAYGTGTIHISGNQQNVTFDVGMKTEAHTKVFIPFASSLNASENSFITFVDKKAPVAPVEKIKTKEKSVDSASKTNIKVNLQVDATPDAEVQLLIDPEAGDLIKATGSGSFKLSYDDNESLKLYGSYIINSGLYHFTLQNVIKKDFKIREGSVIKWNGYPFSPDININAYYSLSASLLDLLDESMLTDIKKTTVPINCLLNLTGDLTQPVIKFDIELPQNNDELERRVKNVINSDEMMNRQMIFLLSLGRFYSPETVKNNNQTGNNELTSLVSSTLSSQLNNWLSQVNENLSMGVNYRSAAEGQLTSTEVEVALGAQVLNNRLILNGNIGYRNDILATTSFIGDFDAEYKLNKSGKLRAKAYTHSNDNYYIKNATTQGAGLIYKEDFNNIKELINSYWSKLFIRKKEDKNE
jgi:hypothetical protein